MNRNIVEFNGVGWLTTPTTTLSSAAVYSKHHAALRPRRDRFAARAPSSPRTSTSFSSSSSSSFSSTVVCNAGTVGWRRPGSSEMAIRGSGSEEIAAAGWGRGGRVYTTWLRPQNGNLRTTADIQVRLIPAYRFSTGSKDHDHGSTGWHRPCCDDNNRGSEQTHQHKHTVATAPAQAYSCDCSMV
eukprot:COSAG05_NODE_2527_length_2943_cov_197.693741_3_plen_185_part_00